MESFLRMSSNSSRQHAQAEAHGDSQDSSIPRTSVTSISTSQDCNKSEFIKWQVSTELGRDGYRCHYLSFLIGHEKLGFIAVCK